MHRTVFDKILSGELPADRVYEDDSVLAFRDINPQAPIHVLVIPKAKFTRFTEIASRPIEETGRFFSAVSKVAALLNLDSAGYRVVVNNGRDGGQAVEYFHAHILAGRKLAWPPG